MKAAVFIFSSCFVLSCSQQVGPLQGIKLYLNLLNLLITTIILQLHYNKHVVHHEELKCIFFSGSSSNFQFEHLQHDVTRCDGSDLWFQLLLVKTR